MEIPAPPSSAGSSAPANPAQTSRSRASDSRPHASQTRVTHGVGIASVIYTAVDVATRLLVFLLMIFLSHALTTEDFGAFGLLMTISGLLGIVFTFGLDIAAGRWFFGSHPETFARLVFTLLLANLALIVAATLLLDSVFTRNFGSWFTGIDYLPLGRYALLIGIAVALSRLPLAILISRRDVRGVSVLILAVSLLPTICLGWAALRWPGDLHRIMAANLTGNFVVGAISVLAALRFASVGFEWKEFRRALGYGLRLLPMAIAISVFSLADRYLLGELGGLEAIAFFHLSSLVSAGVTLVGLSITRAWSPTYMAALTSGDGSVGTKLGKPLESKLALESGATPESDRVANIRRITRNVATTFFVVGAIPFIWGDEALRLVAPQEYQSSLHLVPLLVGGTTLAILYFIPGVALLYSKRTGLLSLNTALAAGLNLWLNYMWIPTWGPVGAGWATLVSYFALFLLTWVSAHRTSPVPLRTSEIAVIFALGIPLIASALVVYADCSAAIRLPVKLGVTVLTAAAVLRSGYADDAIAVVRRIRAKRLEPRR